ncbi:MAG TPA: hypothetical protein VJ508_15845, partial [Saprospiraceae bacterium]|nr:hypothetical protein [Saprospiraceae bacterium]
GNYNYASGDDLFLAEKMRSHFPDQIGFTKSIRATVVTTAKSTWRELLLQRIRWSGKNKALKNPVIRLIWGFVGLYHLALCMGMLMAILTVLPWWPFLVMLSFKWVADYFVLQPSAFFFKRIEVLRKFIPLQLLYSWYILRLGTAILLHQQDDWDGKRGTG